jgi:hypothetical protein
MDTSILPSRAVSFCLHFGRIDLVLTAGRGMVAGQQSGLPQKQVTPSVIRITPK